MQIDFRAILVLRDFSRYWHPLGLSTHHKVHFRDTGSCREILGLQLSNDDTDIINSDGVTLLNTSE